MQAGEASIANVSMSIRLAAISGAVRSNWYNLLVESYIAWFDKAYNFDPSGEKVLLKNKLTYDPRGSILEITISLETRP